MSRAAKHHVPRAVRSMIRRSADAALDVQSRSWRLLLAAASVPALRDEAALLQVDTRNLVRALEEMVGSTITDLGEGKRLTLAP